MRYSFLLGGVLLFFVVVACDSENSGKHQRNTGVDTLRNHSGQNYTILVTKTASVSETGSSEGVRSIQFLNKELREIIRTLTAPERVHVSFSQLKIPPTVISVQFNTFPVYEEKKRNGLLLNELTEVFGLKCDTAQVEYESVWISDDSDIKLPRKKNYFTMKRNRLKVTIEGGTVEEILNVLNTDYSNQFHYAASLLRSYPDQRFDFSYPLKDQNGVKTELERSGFVVNDTLIALKTYRFY